MAKKKKSQRKRNFAYSSGSTTQPKTASSPAVTKIESTKLAVKENKAVAPPVAADNQDYLRHDLRMILVLATGCIILELALWFLLQHTGLGHVVFGS